MRELQRKQKIKRIMYSTPSLILLATLAFFLARGAFGIMRVERESANKVKVLETEVSLLAMRESELKEDIAFLQTEEGIVEEIKKKFSVTQRGEQVAIIVEPRAATSSENVQESWLKRFWYAIIRIIAN